MTGHLEHQFLDYKPIRTVLRLVLLLRRFIPELYILQITSEPIRYVFVVSICDIYLVREL